ncbi:MAG: Uma2 family endonuclease [Gemmatimonadaceae bacterium]
MPAISRRRWTAADVRAIMDPSRHWPRYELLDGELLVTPAPASQHQLAITALLTLLDPYCRSERLGVALPSPADIQLAPESIMQPDVFVVPRALIPADRPPHWPEVTWLLLAAEVLSPSSISQDRVRKRDFYLSKGVREYWIADLDARFFERWTPEQDRPEIVRDVLTWHPAGAREPLRIDLDEFFHERCLLKRYL